MATVPLATQYPILPVFVRSFNWIVQIQRRGQFTENSPVSCHSAEILEDTPILSRTIVVAARSVGFDWRLLIFRFAFPTCSTTAVPPISQIFTAFTHNF